MKKCTMILLVTIALCLGMTGCSASDSKKAETKVETQAAETETAETEAVETKLPETEAAETEATEAVETEAPETEAPETEAPETERSGIDPEFKAAMDSYEEFYDEYCEFLESYADSDNPLEMLVQYTELVAKAEEMDKKMEAWDEDEMTDEELAYYIDVNARVQKRLLEVQ